MINVFHLIWIIPVSAVGGIILAVWILLVDNCLWRASDDPDDLILPPEDWNSEEIERRNKGDRHK